MTDKVYAFVFRGLLCEEALDNTDRLPRFGASAVLDLQAAQRLSIDLLDQEAVAKARRMATVYTAIAAFENSVREFVTKILLDNLKEHWWETGVSEKIRNKAESRREEESKVRWHTPRGDTPLNYTEFGDLTSIIAQNWTLFEPYLESQDWVRQIISTLERSRNVIMHSGDLANVDIERIGTSIRDWVKQAGA
jgi:hypothetical protein